METKTLVMYTPTESYQSYGSYKHTRGRSDVSSRSNSISEPNTSQRHVTSVSQSNQTLKTVTSFWPNDSGSTLMGSALDRKLADGESIKELVDTRGRLDEIRRLLAKDNLGY